MTFGRPRKPSNPRPPPVVVPAGVPDPVTPVGAPTAVGIRPAGLKWVVVEMTIHDGTVASETVSEPMTFGFACLRLLDAAQNLVRAWRASFRRSIP